ncbi:MAG TPA: benzoate-CoA ligase family protein [Pyrinomonadaceae bacterium]|nr:benzoate-CoA ligase family protein [Pyrinomonadaceae bacterium]
MNLFERLFPASRSMRQAVWFESRKIVYAELRAEAVRVAEVLNALGVENGDRVAILLADSPEFIATFVAVISIGAIAVPINPALGREDQLFILKDCSASAAVVEAQSASALFENSPALKDLKNLILVRRGEEIATAIAGVNIEDFADAPRWPLEQFSVVPREGGASPHGPASDTEADAFILYTSGSTGEPKGAVHTEADIFCTNETYCREVLKPGEGDRLFSSSRLPFAYGLGNSFTFPLLNGQTTILCREKPTPEVVRRILSECRPTIFFGVPVVYRMLLEHHRTVASLDCSSLRLCVSAGEALPAQLGQEWQQTFGVEVLDGIGSTEMLHMFMSNHSGEVRYGSSGRLLSGYEAKLITHEGVGTKIGEVGNLWIRGHSAASRYWQRAETSAETFVDGWTRTGDLYRCDADGFWWHMGRSDDCFKPTGQWVSPIEVESVLLRHESTRAAAVVEGFDEAGLSCVCAFVVLAEGSEPGKAESHLRALCADVLPRFKQPRRYLFVAELPYTATGKVQRFKLREQLRNVQSPLRNVQSPTSKVQRP